MQPSWKRTIVGLVLLWASESQAFYYPTLNPPAPTASDTISIDIRAGDCYYFGGDPRDGVVTTNGTQITIVVPALFNGFCTFPTRTRPYVVGKFPPGNYTLDMYYQLGWTSGGGAPRFMGRLAFSVAPQGAAIEAPIPALSTSAKLLLILASAALAAIYRRKVHA